MTRTQRDQEMAAGAVPADQEALRAQIRRTRAELGDTIEVLAATADLRSRLRERWAAFGVRARRRTAEVVGTLRSRAAGLAARRRGRSG